MPDKQHKSSKFEEIIERLREKTLLIPDNYYKSKQAEKEIKYIDLVYKDAPKTPQEMEWFMREYHRGNIYFEDLIFAFRAFCENINSSGGIG